MDGPGMHQGGTAAPPDFGRSEGAAGQRRRAALLPAPPDFWPLVHPCNVVGMSIEKLFDMWRNDEFWNFHATYSNVFFEVQNWDSQDSAETAAHIT